MKHYEMLCIIPARYTEEELKGVEGKITELIKKYEGEITFTENLGNRKIAYPIKNIQNGFYLVIEFDIEQPKLKELDGILKLTPEVLRHQIITKKVKTEEELRREKMIQEKIEKKKLAASEEKEAEEAKTPEPQEATEEKVEEKIEEKKEETSEEKSSNNKESEEKVEEKKEDTPKTDEKQKVSLEELDKKLGDILKGDIL